MPLTIDATGVTIQTADEIAAERAASIRSATGNASLAFTGDTVLGQINTADADREASIQEQFLGAVQASNPQQAAGAQLDGLVPIGGLTAKPATHSTVGVTLAGTIGAVIPVGVLFGSPAVSYRWSLDASVTLAAATAWAHPATYAAGDVVSANGQVWICHVGGATGAGDAPTGTAPVTTGDGLRWYWVATADGTANGTAHAVDTGPIAVAANGLTVIVTPQPGLSGVCNADDAAPGADAETDAALRQRYTGSFHQPGNCTLDAIFAHLDALTGVSDLVVYENTSLLPDATKGNMPGKSVWAIIDGTATAAEIESTLYASTAAGIQIGFATAPNVVAGSYVNSQGQTIPIYWSTPAQTLVAVAITLPTATVLPPGTTQAQVTALLQAATGPVGAYFAARKIGADVQWYRVLSAIGDYLESLGIDADTIGLTLNGGTVNVAAVYNAKPVINGAISVVWA